MKYILLTALSFYSLSAMQKPQKPAANPKLVSPDEQVIQLQEQVREIKEKQTITINKIATEMNDNFNPDNSTQSVMLLAEHIQSMTPEAFAESINEKLEKEMRGLIRESGEAIRRLGDCYTTLVDLKKRKAKGKKLSAPTELNELSSFIQTKQAIQESFIKIAKLQYYLNLYYNQEENKPTQALIEQKDN